MAWDSGGGHFQLNHPPLNFMYTPSKLGCVNRPREWGMDEVVPSLFIFVTLSLLFNHIINVFKLLIFFKGCFIGEGYCVPPRA